MFESASRLKLRLLCTPATPVADLLTHSPPLPLIVALQCHVLRSTKAQGDTLFALQHADRVVSISVNPWCSEDSEMLMALDRAFPTLKALSLSNQDGRSVVLPGDFVAPHLRTLHLRSVAVSAVSSLLTKAIANLISLRLERMQASSYVHPEHLAKLISSIPRLEHLSIGFMPLSPFKTKETWHPQVTRAVLHNLRSLTYTGDCAYLEKLLALIGTPLLQLFRVNYFTQRTLALQSLSEFLGTIHDLNFGTAVISFSGSVTVTYYPTQPSDSLSCLTFSMDNNMHPLKRHIATMVQICAATTPALHAMESLALEFDRPYVPDGLAARSGLWRALLRSFKTVVTLQSDIALAPELFGVLNPDDGVETEELLPMLCELAVVSRSRHLYNPFASFIHARCLAGHPLTFRVIERRPSPPLFIPRYFDVFECMI